MITNPATQSAVGALIASILAPRAAQRPHPVVIDPATVLRLTRDGRHVEAQRALEMGWRAGQ